MWFGERGYSEAGGEPKHGQSHLSEMLGLEGPGILGTC